MKATHPQIDKARALAPMIAAAAAANDEIRWLQVSCAT